MLWRLWLLVVSDRQTDQGTRSPIELFWTAKKWPCVSLMVHGYIKSSWVKHGVCMSWVCSNMSFHIFSFALCWKETPHIFFLKNSQTILGCFGGTWENIFDRNKALFQSSLGQRHLSIPILSWSPNSNYLYFWCLFVDRQIQKTPSSSAGQQDLRERSPCCFFRPSAWLSSNQTPACLLSLSNGISSLRTCSMWDK